MSVRWTAPDGQVWERSGSCPPSQCQGRCCQEMIFGPFAVGAGQREWVELHGSTVEAVGERVIVRIPMPCQALTDEGLCSIYESPERPQLCDDWPQNPAALATVPSCGYRFEPVSGVIDG